MRVAAPVLGPAVLIDIRVWIAALGLLAVLAFRRQRPHILHRSWRYLVLGAVNAALPFTLIATAELSLSAAVAAILNATTPMFTALVARVWISDPLTRKKLVGLLLGILGVGVLVGWQGTDHNPSTGWAIAASLGAALAYGIGGVFSSRAFRGERPLDLALGQQLGAALVLLPLALVHPPTHWPSWPVVGSVLGLAILSTSIGYLLYFHLMARVGPVKTLTVTFLVPIFGVLWGAVFLQEPLLPSMVVGLLIILASVVLVNNVPLPFQSTRLKQGPLSQSGKGPHV